MIPIYTWDMGIRALHIDGRPPLRGVVAIQGSPNDAIQHIAMCARVASKGFIKSFPMVAQTAWALRTFREHGGYVRVEPDMVTLDSAQLNADAPIRLDQESNCCSVETISAMSQRFGELRLAVSSPLLRTTSLISALQLLGHEVDMSGPCIIVRASRGMEKSLGQVCWPSNSPIVCGPDIIDAVNWATLSAVTDGELALTNVPVQEIDSLLEVVPVLNYSVTDAGLVFRLTESYADYKRPVIIDSRRIRSDILIALAPAIAATPIDITIESITEKTRGHLFAVLKALGVHVQEMTPTRVRVPSADGGLRPFSQPLIMALEQPQTSFPMLTRALLTERTSTLCNLAVLSSSVADLPERLTRLGAHIVSEPFVEAFEL